MDTVSSEKLYKNREVSRNNIHKKKEKSMPRLLEDKVYCKATAVLHWVKKYLYAIFLCLVRQSCIW